MHGVAPHMCGRGGSPLLGRGAGGRSPGYLLDRPRLLQHERRLLSTIFSLGVAGAWKMPPREETARTCRPAITLHPTIAARIRCDLPPPAAPRYRTSVALLRSATSCFGCSTNVNESFPLIAAAPDEDLRLEIDAAAFDIMRYVIAVLLGCQASCCPFAGVDTQPSHVAILLCGSVSNLNAFLETVFHIRAETFRPKSCRFPGRGNISRRSDCR